MTGNFHVNSSFSGLDVVSCGSPMASKNEPGEWIWSLSRQLAPRNSGRRTAPSCLRVKLMNGLGKSGFADLVYLKRNEVMKHVLHNSTMSRYCFHIGTVNSPHWAGIYRKNVFLVTSWLLKFCWSPATFFRSQLATEFLFFGRQQLFWGANLILKLFIGCQQLFLRCIEPGKTFFGCHSPCILAVIFFW